MEKVLFKKAEMVLRENGFWYCDLIESPRS